MAFFLAKERAPRSARYRLQAPASDGASYQPQWRCAKERASPQRLSLFEKIKAKVNYYVVLKTALSALTGGLVGLTLLVCGARP